MPAAQYFEAAALQSREKAWQFHDRLFQEQEKLSPDFFKQVAKELGLDVARLEKDAASPAIAERIKADIAEAERFGIQGTPGYIIDGVPLRGAYPINYFEEIIRQVETSRR
jgi:predicted DsbA family dithiol-disulfide isomerase